MSAPCSSRCCRARKADLIRRATLAATVVVLVFAWSLLAQFDPAVAGIQFYETHAWHARLGSSFSLGVDGFSFPLVLLATLLMPVAVVASGGVKNGAKLYFSLLLLLETAMLGVFMARDWSLFYVFWELTLIPLFFLIDRLGGKNRQRRQKAALNFVLYTMGGSVFMLIALLLLYDAVPTHSFDMGAIAEAARGLPHRDPGLDLRRPLHRLRRQDGGVPDARLGAAGLCRGAQRGAADLLRHPAQDGRLRPAARRRDAARRGLGAAGLAGGAGLRHAALRRHPGLAPARPDRHAGLLLGLAHGRGAARAWPRSTPPASPAR